MPEIRIDATVLGLEELNGRLTDPGLVRDAQRYILKGGVAIGKRTAMESLKGRGTGLAKQTVRTSVRAMEGRVYSMMSDARLESMHKGRAAGTQLPYEMVARWVTGRPYLTRRRMASLSKAEWSLIMEAWHAIQSGGAKAVAFFPEAQQAIEHALPGLISRAAARIQEKFNA